MVPLIKTIKKRWPSSLKNKFKSIFYKKNEIVFF